MIVNKNALRKKATSFKINLNIHVNDSQNLAFPTSHFVIELLPFDYLSNQKSESTKKCISRGIISSPCLKSFAQ
jgi:hypothetical protein